MISIADAKNQLPALIHQAEAGKPVTITRRGKPVAVVVSVQEYEHLRAAPAQHKPCTSWRAKRCPPPPRCCLTFCAWCHTSTKPRPPRAGWRRRPLPPCGAIMPAFTACRS